MKLYTKTLIAATLALAAVGGVASAASAATADLRFANNTYVSGGFLYGYRYFLGTGNSADCFVSAALPTAGNAVAYGEIPCNSKHTYTDITVTLNITTPTGTFYRSTPTNRWWNSKGTGYNWTPTPAFTCNPSYRYQAVTSAVVDGVPSYATTGAPTRLC